MDLATVKPSEAILEIVHPGTGEQLGIKVPLLSLDDDALKKMKLKIQNDEKNLSRRGKTFTAEQIEANTSLLAFTAMQGWSWGQHAVRVGNEARMEETTFHGDKPAFTVANVYKVFDELPWFRDQITEKVGDTKSFFTT